MKSRFPPFAFVELVSPYDKKNITLTRFVLFAIVCWFDVDVLKRQLVVSEQGETGVPYFPMYRLTFPDLKICQKKFALDLYMGQNFKSKRQSNN